MLGKTWSVTTISMLCVLCVMLALVPGSGSAAADMSEPYWTFTSEGMEEIRGIQISDDGRVVAFIGNEGNLVVLDIIEKETLWEYEPVNDFDFYRPFKLSADGSTILAVDDVGTLFYFSVQEGNQPLWTHPSSGYVDMVINRNGSLMHVLNVGVVTTFDEEGLVSTSPFTASLTNSARISMAMDTGYAVAYDGLFTYTYYPSSGTWNGYDEIVGPELYNVMIADDGLTSMYLYTDGTVQIGKSNKLGGKVWTFPEIVDYVGGVLLSRDGSSVVCQRSIMAGTLVSIYDTAGENLVWNVMFDSGGYIKLTGDGQTMLYSFFWSSLTRSYDKWDAEILSESGRGFGDICVPSYDGSTVVLTDLYAINVFHTPEVEVEEDEDDGQLELIAYAGLAIGVANLVMLAFIILRKK